MNRLRAHFPALQSGFAFMENAGGSQVPQQVIESVARYYRESYVQLGAGYGQANVATETVEEAHRFAHDFVNAGTLGKVVLGPSTTALTTILAQAYSNTITLGDEIIVAVTNHEANAGPWVRLAEAGAVIKFWPVDPETWVCEPSVLASMLSARTRLVAMPHVSNILGQFERVKEAIDLAHSVGAEVCVDGVAYAPHRAIDVADLGADWYVASLYKVYAPHMALLFGRTEAFAELVGPNHFFIPEHDVPYRWELGGVSHEACAGLLGMRDYLAEVTEKPYAGRATVEEAFTTFAELEALPHRALLEMLREIPGLRFIGSGEPQSAVPTVSFLVEGKSSRSIAERVNASGTHGIRHGNMYAVRLMDELGIDREDGVIRISLVHYNTVDEVERLRSVILG